MLTRVGTLTAVVMLTAVALVADRDQVVQTLVSSASVRAMVNLSRRRTVAPPAPSGVTHHDLLAQAQPMG
jgi:hypothetical protein